MGYPTIQVAYVRASDDDCVSSSAWPLKQLERFGHVEGLLEDPDVTDVWLRFPGEGSATYVKGGVPVD